MSKPLLVLLGALFFGAVGSVFGQGNVVFNNFGPNTNWRIYTNHFGVRGLMANTGTHYRFGLYVGATNSSSLELVGTVGNTGLSPGYFSGQNPFTLPAPYAAGTPINFQIRGWSVAGGASYETAVIARNAGNFAIFLGESDLGAVTPAGVGPAAPLFGTAPGLLTNGFELRIIPEPSTLALGVLGLCCLALFRPRRQS